MEIEAINTFHVIDRIEILHFDVGQSQYNKTYWWGISHPSHPYLVDDWLDDHKQTLRTYFPKWNFTTNCRNELILAEILKPSILHSVHIYRYELEGYVEPDPSGTDHWCSSRVWEFSPAHHTWQLWQSSIKLNIMEYLKDYTMLVYIYNEKNYDEAIDRTTN